MCGPITCFLFSLSHWKSDKSIHKTYAIKIINTMYTDNTTPFDCPPLLGKKFQTEAQGESVSTVVFPVARGQVFSLCVFSLSLSCVFFSSPHPFYTVQQEICFVSIVLAMFLPLFIQGQESLSPLGQDAELLSLSGAAGVGEGGRVTCLPLCKTLQTRGGSGSFPVRSSLVLKAECLNLSFTFTSDISAEVVITNSMCSVIVWETRGPSWD